MALDKDREALTPSLSPPCHQDRLFQDLAKFSRNKHATQLVPKPGEFNLGQGDPLMEAVVEHWKVQASEGSHRQLSVKDLEIEDKGGFRRQRRHTRTKQRSLPDMSQFQMQKRQEEKAEEMHEVDHLIEHGSPFAGMGMNDVVHLKNGTVLSVPCVSSELYQQIASNKKRRTRNQRRHSMPHLFGRRKTSPHDHHDEHHDEHRHSGLGFSKVVEIGKHFGHGTLLPMR
jgi:hypothetical protein